MATTTGKFTAGIGSPSSFQSSVVLGLDLNDTDSRAVFDVQHVNRIAFQLVQATGAWATANIEIQRTLNGVTWVSWGTPKNITAVGIVDGIDVADYASVSLKVTVAEGSAATVDITASRSKEIV